MSIEGSGSTRQILEDVGSTEVCVVLSNPVAGNVATVNIGTLETGDAVGMKQTFNSILRIMNSSLEYKIIYSKTKHTSASRYR